MVKRIFSTVVLLTLTITALGYFFWYKPKTGSVNNNRPFSFFPDPENEPNILPVKEKTLALQKYAADNGFNNDRCFLADMKISSGKKRFFVYNLKKDSIELAGLVAHGSGSDTGGEDLYFSNTPNSNCTSLGKYKIGNSYMGKFGLAYKLYGLEESNSNAFKRFVVLHAHSCVPNEEISPLPLCESWGCPTVAPAFLSELKTIISHSEKPILLWIYD